MAIEPIEGLEIRSSNDAGFIKYQPVTLTLASKEKKLDSKENPYYSIRFLEIDGLWRCSGNSMESWGAAIAATELGSTVEVRLTQSPPSRADYPPWHNIEGWKLAPLSSAPALPSAPKPSAGTDRVPAEYMVADLRHYKEKDALIALQVTVKAWVDMATGNSDYEEEAVTAIRQLENLALKVLKPPVAIPEPFQTPEEKAPPETVEELEW